MSSLNFTQKPVVSVYSIEIEEGPDEIVLAARNEQGEGGSEIGMTRQEAALVGVRLLAASGYSTEVLVAQINHGLVKRA